MKKKKLKFKKLVVLSIMIFVFFISLLNKTTVAIAETYSSSTTESTYATHPIGHKIEGAKYWDYHEEYDKSRVITGEDGGRGGSGGSGSGGSGGGTGGKTGSGSGSGTGAGNSGAGGTGNSAGGVGGGMAGTNIGGSGTGLNGTGSGSGVSGGSNNAGAGGGTGVGNNAAISARQSLIQSINESREESYAKILETAQDKNKAMESILARESMLESIEREMARESIKAKFYDDSVVKENEIPTEASKAFSENSGPPQEIEESTTAKSVFQWFVDFSDLFKESETTRETNPLDKPTLEPVAQNSNLVTDQDIMPSESDYRFYEFTEVENQVETRQNAQYVRPLEPQDFIEQSTQSDQNNKQETLATAEPTAANNNEQNKAETKQEENNNQVTEEATKEEGSGKENEKEDLGSEGGKDRDKDADLAGDNSKNNDSSDQGGGGGQGNADGKGKGIKIIEIDSIGGIGVGANGKSIDLMKLIINLILLLCFILGIVFHFADIGYRKEVKKGYF